MVIPKLLQAAVSLLACVSVSEASYAKNLNYRSPSENHPSLSISIHKVNKRNDVSKAFDPKQLNFTHGVASGGKGLANAELGQIC